MNVAAAIIGVFIVLLILSAVAQSYVQSRRAIENMRAIESRKERSL